MAGREIPVVAATDAERLVATDQAVWFGVVPDIPAGERLLGLPDDQRFAADVEGADPATYAGVYGVYPMSLGVPGDQVVPCAGLTWVGVHPDHRRQGVLTAMMRDHIARVHDDEGTHISALHASEPSIYGRFGYGLASLELEVTLGRGTAFTAPDLDKAAAATQTRMDSISEPDMPKRMRECHLGSAEVGTVVGELEFYARVCQELPEEHRGKEPRQVLVARREGADTGFAIFRRTHNWEQGRPAGRLDVSALVGDATARLALLRRLVDFDLMGSVTLRAVGLDDPLLLWAGGPRSTSDVAPTDSLWVRLVDLPEALTARRWNAPCEVVVAVADDTAPWNDDTWMVKADADGTATVERSTADPSVELGVAALGAAFLGGGNLVAMHRAGLVTERRPGAVTELWRAMRSDVLPTAAWMF